MTRERLIEVMARGMCIADERDPDDGSYVLHAFHKDRPAWKDFERSATAALSAIEAAGVRLVPVEADKPMLKAAIDNAPMTLIKEQPTGLRRARYGWSDAECAEVYTAMLAASPYAPAQKDESHE